MRIGFALALAALAAVGCGSSKSQPTATSTTSSPIATNASRVPAHRQAVVKPKPKPAVRQKPQHQTKATTTTPTTTSTTPKTTTTTTTTAAKRAAAAPAPGVTVDTGSSNLGTILVDSRGHTLYLFKKDTGSTSSCSGACASVWPPYTTKGAPVAGSGVQSGLLGTTQRTDGTTQVTYGGHPLYYLSGDSSAGATSGEGLTQFCAKWFVVSPSGGSDRERQAARLISE